MLRRVIPLVLSLVLGTGCAAGSASPPQTVVRRDPYTQTVKYVSPILTSRSATPSWHATLIRIDHKQNSDYVLLVNVGNFDWLFLDRAHDTEGRELKVIDTDRNVVQHNWISETVTLSVSRTYLMRHSTTGLRFRLDGGRGSVEIAIGPHWVTEFLAATTDQEVSAGRP